MELDPPDEGDDDDRPFRAPLPPDDRIWRHPSELSPDAGPAAAAAPPPAPPPARAHVRSWLVGVVGGVVGAAMVLAVVAATGGLRAPAPAREFVVREAVAPALPPDPPLADGSVVAIADRALAAIARIEVQTTDGRTAAGSGVVFRGGGYVLTNSHVVEGAERINVVLPDGRELPGELLGRDDETDVAVVKASGDEELPVAVLGTAVGLKVGQPAVAIGSPLGQAGGPSVTVGVISALGRHVTTADGRALLDMIQTDAPIAPGSSGGALLDSAGSVIGITTAVALGDEGAEGLGFATPIDVAHTVARDIIATGHAVHVWLGLTGTDLPTEDAEALGVPGGARVKAVHPGSPAAGTDVRPGDVVVAIAGRTIGSMTDLVVQLRSRRPGDEVELVWYRDGTLMAATVPLAERPPR